MGHNERVSRLEGMIGELGRPFVIGLQDPDHRARGLVDLGDRVVTEAEFWAMLEPEPRGRVVLVQVNLTGGEHGG